jgi:hypothetical protein
MTEAEIINSYFLKKDQDITNSRNSKPTIDIGD